MTPDERRDAINEAAMKPELYTELFARFGGKVPSDDVIRAFLIRQYKFAPTGADNFIKAFRETIDLVERNPATSEPQVSHVANEEITETPLSASEAEVDTRSNRAESLPSGERLTFRISPSAKVHVIFEGDISRTSIERLIQFLDLTKDSYEQ